MNVIKASAGSGKTYTLARTYIANLIGVPTGSKTVIDNKEFEHFKLRTGTRYHRHILAITFTNKATDEMKERIISQLHKLSKGEGDFVDDFKIMFPGEDINNITKAARNALCDILFDYGSFNVSTIDSFFQRILRNFARELDRDYNYGIELDEDYALGVAIHDFLKDLGGKNKDQKAIDDWVRSFIAYKINNNNSWDFFGAANSKTLLKFSEIIFKEFFRERHEEIIKYLSDIGSGNGLSSIMKFKQALINQRDLQLQSFNDTPSVIREFLKKHGINQDDIDQRTSIHKFATGNDAPIQNENSIKTLRNYSDSEDALHNNVLRKAARDRISYDAALEFKQLLKNAFKHLDTSKFLDKTSNIIWSLGLLGKINEKLDKFRKDTNSIMIADTNEFIGQVLKSGATFIYEHAGNVLYNYMIDEFQDTSHKQYDNFKPLLYESIARANKNLIIGDEKQAIYRFRNSDPSILREEIAKDFDAHITSLDTNYRSYGAIVNFNNALFEQTIEAYRDKKPGFESLSLTYNNITQKQFKDSLPGYVSIHAVPYPTSISDKPARDQIIKSLPLYINSIRQRGIAPKDIAILVNTKKEGSDIIEYLLQYNNSLDDNNQHDHIDIISAESLLLKNSPSVRLIISVLQFLDITQYQLKETNDPAEDDDTKAIQNDPFEAFVKKRVKEQRRFKLLHDFEASIQALDSEADMGPTLLNCFANDLEETKNLSPEKRQELYSRITKEILPDPKCELTSLVNIVDKIIDKYILPASKHDSNKKLENSFILAFMNVVLEFSNRHNGGTVREFLQFWDNKKDRLAVSSPSDANAVNVMTIHKSKGLEFKCIIIPFSNWKLINLGKELWIRKEDWLQCNEFKSAGADNPDIVPPLIPVDPDSLRKSGLLSDIINHEDECSLIDNLNKLYVALTRPKEELHIFAPVHQATYDTLDSLSIDNVTDAASLILRFAKTNINQGMNFNYLEQDIDCWEEVSSSQSPQNEDVESSKMHVFSFCYGQQSITADHEPAESSTMEMPDYYVNSRTMPVNVSLHSATGSIKTEGIRMHKLFSMVRSCEDFDYVKTHGVENGFFANNQFWTLNRFDSLIKTIADDDTLMSWFAPDNTIYNERSIGLPSGNDDIELHRPDRIVKRPDGEIIVVDYKFGSKTDKATIARHSSQVRQYINLLAQFGYDNIKGYIWYAQENKIVTVDLDKKD